MNTEICPQLDAVLPADGRGVGRPLRFDPPVPRSSVGAVCQAGRVAWRAAQFAAFMGGALGGAHFQKAREGLGVHRAMDLRARAEWVHRKAIRLARLLHLQVSVEGVVPRSGLLVANHLSYIDVVVLATLRPFVFVCKSDVRHWPFLGEVVAHGGTIFVERERRCDVLRVASEMSEAIQLGLPVVVFPEGTSSDGTRVLPFHASLLASAASLQAEATPAALRYGEGDGRGGGEVAYWGNMTFGTHLLRLMGLTHIPARVQFGEPLFGDDRRDLARRLRAAVISMLGTSAEGGKAMPPVRPAVAPQAIEAASGLA